MSTITESAARAAILRHTVTESAAMAWTVSTRGTLTVASFPATRTERSEFVVVEAT
jgi:hypothetical protein